MRKRFVLTLVGAGVALSMGMAPSAFASGPGGSELVKIYLKPVAGYKTATCVFDLSAIADGTQVDSLAQCSRTASFSTTMTKASVASTWATWGSPPNTETATPNVLYMTDNSSSVLVTLSKTSVISGAEAEPAPFSVHDIALVLYSNTSAVLGEQVRSIDGSGGALLLAAKTKPAAKYLFFSSDANFGIANLRVK